MKNQNEPGYTMIPNKLMDAFITFPCTSLKQEILLFIIRHTFGCHRECVTTTAVHIAEQICRNKVKTSVALRELIHSSVVIEVIGERGSRSFSLNMNTLEWRPRPLPERLEIVDENPDDGVPEIQETVSRTGKDKTPQKENSLSGKGNFEVSLHDTHSSDKGNFETSKGGNIRVSRAGYTPSIAYIDGKNENSGPKENIKEKERNIYSYDITLIPPALAGKPFDDHKVLN